MERVKNKDCSDLIYNLVSFILYANMAVCLSVDELVWFQVYKMNY